MKKQAINRVNSLESLKKYYDLLIEYEWENPNDHYQWVATAPIAEIVAWAETIRRDEKGEMQ